MWSIWLIAAAVFLVGEILTEGFLLLWFAIGALIGMILSFFIPNIIIQFAIFLIISFLLLCFTRPLTKKFLSSKSKRQSNVHSLINQTAYVIETIDSKNGTGKIKINGEVWKAITNTDDVINEGEEIIIKAIDGVKLIVSKAKATSLV